MLSSYSLFNEKKEERRQLIQCNASNSVGVKAHKKTTAVALKHKQEKKKK